MDIEKMLELHLEFKEKKFDEEEKSKYFLRKSVSEKEKENYNTTWTRNKEFDLNGCLLLKNILDPKDFVTDIPEHDYDNGCVIEYYGSIDNIKITPDESQVKGAISRYNYPPFKQKHYVLKKKLENIIGRELYSTYYFDRFYFPGQELEFHTDRPSCEISLTFNIRTNLEEDWPLWVKTPDTYTDDRKEEVLKEGKNISFILNQGDGVLYKGCERPHWRDKMPGDEFINGKRVFYHQIFFHYVLADGIRSHFAGDSR